MKYALGNILNGGVMSRLDPDAKAYILRSGATDTNTINNFVIGVKALGLWNNMICWPLRSAQNAGTGITVHSLGGIGIYNGTLVNGPAWGSNWMTFNDVTRSMSVALLPFNSRQLFQMDVIRARRNTNGVFGSDITCTPSNSFNYFGNTVSGGTTFGSGIRTSDAGSFSGYSTGTAISELQVGVAFGGYDGTTQHVEWARTYSSRTVSSSITMSNPRYRLNVRADNTFQGGLSDYAFSAWFTANPSSSIFTSLQNLYKNTLGQGLGLP